VPMLSNLLAILLLGQVQVPSVTVPPVTERSIIFTDAGNTYLIKLDSQTVHKLEPGGDIQPLPPDDDTRPRPPVPPPTTVYKYAAIVLERQDSRNSWRDDSAIRAAIAAKDAKIRFYSVEEQDIVRLGYQPFVTSKGLPLLLLFDANEKLIQAKKITTETELLESLK